MGLAASQARFLAITSRKASCEFQSMQIAQDKLSVTRDLAQISKDYQDALNATTLVWDYDGSGESAFNLSYGVLMTPTVMNNFNPYLITTRTGSVVLNQQMSSAAKIISPNGAPVQRSAQGFHDFMDALGACGAVNSSTVKDIQNMTDLHYTYVDESGVTRSKVNPSLDDIKDNSMRIDKNYTNGYSIDAGYGATPLNKNEANISNTIGLAYKLKDVKLENVFNNTNSEELAKYIFYSNGAEVSLSDLSLGDLLTKDVSVVALFADGQHSEDLANKYIKTPVEELFDLITSTSGELYQLLGVDTISKTALNLAAVTTKDTCFDQTTERTKRLRESQSVNNTRTNLSKYNTIFMTQNNNTTIDSRSKNFNSSAGINLSNMMATYLTNFELILNGYDSYYSTNKVLSSCNFVTSDEYYNFVMQDSSAVTSDVVMKADFYMQLYNNICINGWTESEGDIEDNKYLEQMLKNGSYFVTSVAQDGYFYQDRYNGLDCIVEVKDEDAIARAEAEFNSKKVQLTYKEDKLDLDMKNLDAEISSLTTEYDSVKNLISKNVEKIFSMFQ